MVIRVIEFLSGGELNNQMPSESFENARQTRNCNKNFNFNFKCKPHGIQKSILGRAFYHLIWSTYL